MRRRIRRAEAVKPRSNAEVAGAFSAKRQGWLVASRLRHHRHKVRRVLAIRRRRQRTNEPSRSSVNGSRPADAAQREASNGSERARCRRRSSANDAETEDRLVDRPAHRRRTTTSSTAGPTTVGTRCSSPADVAVENPHRLWSPRHTVARWKALLRTARVQRRDRLPRRRGGVERGGASATAFLGGKMASTPRRSASRRRGSAGGSDETTASA